MSEPVGISPASWARAIPDHFLEAVREAPVV